MEWEYGGSSSPTCSRESSYVRGQGVTLQPAAPSLQHWDSSSTCSRKSRPHFPPGATAQRDPLGRDRAFLRKRGGKVGGVGERVTKKKNNNKILWLGQECAWVNRSQASCHIHSCAGQGGVQGAGGAGSLSGQDTSCQPAPGRQAGSLPPAWGGNGRRAGQAPGTEVRAPGSATSAHSPAWTSVSPSVQ